jgi:hypothetical protein
MRGRDGWAGKCGGLYVWIKFSLHVRMRRRYVSASTRLLSGARLQARFTLQLRTDYRHGGNAVVSTGTGRRTVQRI